ncbi:MAG: acylneuraminate cytidylyltransferase family protein [Pseudomonadales bacterium]|nr:acylneuraminate cytidylyltransferase family protein [Pseudomonadales bacterium]
MKAHSERIPGKNFRPFAGRPLFRWILDTLLDVKEVDLVVINTDARDVLSDHGLVEGDRVKIRDRKPELCGDMVSMNLILQDDIQNVDSDLYLMTHNTNPLLSAETIESALMTFRKSNHDSLFTVNRFQTRFYTKDAEPINHDPANLIRTQDLEPWFEENSCLYLFSKESFAETDARIGTNPMIYEIPKVEAIDIDEPEDWDMAEAVAIHRNNGK